MRTFRPLSCLCVLLLCLMRFAPPALAEGDFLYLLPARDSVPAGEGLEVDYYPAKKEIVVVKLLNEAGEEIRSWRVNASSGRPRRFVWDGRDGKTTAPAGKYTLIFALKHSETEAGRIPFTVTAAEKRPEIAVTAPDAWLPESEEQLLPALLSPLTVAAADADKRVAVRVKPASDARKAGEVWGQTQGLKVLAVEEGWARVGAFRHQDGEYMEGYIESKKLKTEAAGGAFALVVDKQKQTLTLYENGEKRAEMPVSTGKAQKNRLFYETAAGVYLLDTREQDTKEGRMPIRFAGDAMLHAATDTDSLGQKSTRGGIAVPPVSPQNPYGMEWMWTHLPRYTRLIVLDDPAERRRAAEEMSAPAAAAPAATRNPAYVARGATDIRFTFGGDCVLGSDVGEHGLPDSIDSYIREKDPSWPLSGVRHVFSADDLTLVNLETVLQTDTAGFKKRQHNFRGLPEYARADAGLGGSRQRGQQPPYRFYGVGEEIHHRGAGKGGHAVQRLRPSGRV